MNKTNALVYWIKHLSQGCLLLGLGLAAFAVQASSAEQMVQSKLLAIHTMHAHFSQTVKVKQRVISHSSGIMIWVRPNQFRWQVQEPIAQTVIADGKQVSIYDVALEQVTITKQTSQLGMAGALFLSGDPDAVRRAFSVTSQQIDSTDIYDMRAKSEQSNFEHVRLIFKKNILAEIEVDDQLGQHTVMHLSKMVMNQPQPAQSFRLHIPAGVDVVYQ